MDDPNCGSSNEQEKGEWSGTVTGVIWGLIGLIVDMLRYPFEPEIVGLRVFQYIKVMQAFWRQQYSRLRVQGLWRRSFWGLNDLGYYSGTYFLHGGNLPPHRAPKLSHFPGFGVLQLMSTCFQMR